MPGGGVMCYGRSAANELTRSPEMKVAVVQMNSGEDKAQNLTTAERLLVESAERGAHARSEEHTSELQSH